MQINSDDYINIDFVKLLLNGITSSNADIATCSGISTPGDNYQYLSSNHNCNYKVINKYNFMKKYILTHINGKNLIGSDVTTMYKKEVIKTSKYPDGLKNAMDGYFMIDIWLKIQNIAIIDLKLYFWRINPSSITRTLDNDKISAYKVYIDFLDKSIIKIPKKEGSLLFQEKIIAAFFPLRALLFLDNIDNINNKLIRYYTKIIRRNFYRINYWRFNVKNLIILVSFIIFGFRMTRLAVKQIKK